MEHLLLPSGAIIDSSEQAPYVAVEYDEGPYLTYPDRSPDGTLFYRLRPDVMTFMTHEPFTTEEVRRLESFLQTWLCFGLMHEIFGETIVATGFIRRSDAGLVLDTSCLSSILDAWAGQHAGHTENFDHYEACIKRAWHVLTLPNLHRTTGFNTVIITTLVAIGEAINIVVIDTMRPSKLGLQGAGGWFPWRALKLQLEQRMIDSGWCPIDASRWSSHTTGYEHLVYLSKIRQPKLRNHAACTGRKVCLGTQHDMASSATKLHRCSSEACDCVEVDILTVQSILDSGEIALIDIIDADGTIKFEVLSSADKRPYAALSHVWAEGLGNPRANALPACQLRHLADVFKRFKNSCGEQQLCMWLDTLCCPVNSIKHRQWCISQMARIYKEAQYTLVISASLEHFPSADMSALEVLARFVYSPWCTRLWTLQEGALAARLWAQFADRAVDMDTVEKSVNEAARTTSQHKILYTGVLSSYRALRRVTRPQSWELGHKSLKSLVRAVGDRAVTVSSDEGICLFTCMGLDQQTLSHSSPNERMRAFWQAMGEAKRPIPYTSVLFRGQRLKDAGYRWAPASLMTPTQFARLGVDSADHMAHIYPGVGLAFQGTAARIGTAPGMVSLSADFWNGVLQDQDHSWAVRITENHWRLMPLAGEAHKDKELEPSLPEYAHIELGVQAQLAEAFRSPDGVVLLLEDRDLTTAHTMIMAATSLKPGEINQIRSIGMVMLGPADEKFSMFLERTSQLAYDPELLSLLPLLEGWDTERDVSKCEWKGEMALARLPAVMAEKLRSKAIAALELPAVRELLPRPGERAVTDVAAAMVYALAGRLLEVVQTWPDTQAWCLD